MQRSGGAAILMQQDSKLKFLVGDRDVLEAMQSLRPLPVFAGEAVSFLGRLSERLLASREAKVFSDLMTFAFWCRRANIRQMAEAYEEAGLRLGRGVAFHIAPSNVAMNFAYSFAAALLAGNASVVRLPSRQFPQVEILCRVMRDILQEDLPGLRPYVCFVQYGHEKEINDKLSLLADTRIIWGGDRTIETIRRSPLQPRANEITFADRFSLLVIRAEAYLQAGDKERIAQDFYNDTYLTDQNACTSPRLIVWLGEDTQEAQELFWQSQQSFLQQKRYNLSPVQAIDKLDRFCCLAAGQEAQLVRGEDNTIVRVRVKDLSASLTEHMGHSGYFLEYEAKELAEIMPLCQDKRCQTLSYFGMEKDELASFIRSSCPRGIDRMVPMGRTMDFRLVWDGGDLIRAMSRAVMVD